MSDTSQGEGWWQASDGKWYPPQPPATGWPPARTNAQISPALGWSFTAVLLVGIVLVLVTIIGFVSYMVLAYRHLEESRREFDREWEEARSDVQITRCDVDADGVPRVEVEVTNSSSETTDYQVVIEFDSPTGLGGEAKGFVTIDMVEPGQVGTRSEEAPAQLLGTDQVVTTAPDDVTCVVDSAERSASRLG